MNRIMTFISLFLIILSLRGQASLKLETYNLGLAHSFVPYAKERLPHLINSIRKSKTEILCLQEIWTKRDRKKVKKSLKRIFPHEFSTSLKNIKSKKLPTCKTGELFGEGKFVGCMQKKCGGLEDDELITCLTTVCNKPLSDLTRSNRECATSLMAQVGKKTIPGLLTVLNPFKRAGLFTYKGSNGLMLFSKYPLENKEYRDLSKVSTLSRRGVLSANVKADGKSYQIYCTHLTADLSSSTPYTGKFKNWNEENEAQLFKILKEASDVEGPVVLMGDLNCGFSDRERGITAEIEKSCQQIENFGFVSPVARKKRECSFCASNKLNEAEKEGHLIDHILIKGSRAQKVEITFKELINIKVKNKNIKTNLSDHYGVRVILD